MGSLAIFNPKAELPNVFEYVDLESVVGTEMLSHRTESKRTAPSRAQRLAQTGDLFYQTVRPYQKNNFLFEKSDKYYVFSTGYAQMRPVVDGLFLLCIVQSNGFMKVVLDNCTGTSYPSIKSNDLAEIEVYSPINPKEQEYIGKLFKGIDNLITLHQRKYDKLVNVKKAMLEKMFPKDGADVPEIRFKGFTEAWEQRKLDEIVSFFSGLTYSPNDIRPTGTLVLRSSNVKDGEVIDADNVYVDPSVVNSDNVHDGDIIVVVRNGSRTLIGKHAEIKGLMPNTVIGAFMTGIRSEHPSFLNSLLSTPHFDKEIERNMGATINQITGYMFSKMEFMIPSSKEQDAIGEYFKRISNLITLHQRKLEKLKNLKKACLEKMFV